MTWLQTLRFFVQIATTGSHEHAFSASPASKIFHCKSAWLLSRPTVTDGGPKIWPEVHASQCSKLTDGHDAAGQGDVPAKLVAAKAWRCPLTCDAMTSNYQSATSFTSLPNQASPH